jgi:multimeric flavodoxin WrbA
MKIAVLNGSPKGSLSVTLQYALFLQKRFPEHELAVLNVCQDIKRLEEDEAAFREVIQAVEKADAVLWATPVYYLLVPGPYKRFIELVFERAAQAAFRGKYAATLTTSVRFFDHTAHDYLGAVCDDLDMRLAGSYSAEMYDLLREEEQSRLVFFGRAFFRSVERGAATQKKHAPLAPPRLSYAPAAPADKIGIGDRKIVVLVDAEECDANLRRMVDRFRDCLSEPVEEIRLRDLKIRGGCLGCIHCSFDNVCVYRGADDVYEAYRKIVAADVVVEAAAVRDRFLSARWKTFCDRGFFNNHVPVLAGKQIGYLISGPFGQLPHLRQVLEACADVGDANLAGIVTDECDDSRELDRLVDELARRLVECSDARHLGPSTFLGKGGKKVLRDEIWASLRFVFPLDHRYYKQHGLYDFPKRSLGTRIYEGVFGLLLKIPRFRREFQKRMKEEMVKPVAQVVEKA